MGPDLTAARSAIEALMDDACSISAGDGWNDAVLDPQTLQLVDPEPPTRYSGKCMVSHSTWTMSGDTSQGGGPVQEFRQVISIPLDGDGWVDGAGPVVHGDTVTITAAKRDPDLVGAEFTVQEIPHKTYPVKRELRCVRTAGLPALNGGS